MPGMLTVPLSLLSNPVSPGKWFHVSDLPAAGRFKVQCYFTLIYPEKMLQRTNSETAANVQLYWITEYCP